MVRLRKLSLIVLGLVICMGLGLGGAYYVVSKSELSGSISLSQGKVLSENEKTKSQLIYENAWSEQIDLENKAKPYENYIINWVSTFIGKSGFKGQNTSSLKYSDLENKGAFTNLSDLVKVYPNLEGILDSVTINYSYDSASRQLVQEVKVQKRGVDTTRQVFVVYDSTGSVVDYTVGNFNKLGGSSEKD